MKPGYAVVLAMTAFGGWLTLIPAQAAPPTVTPSPGYDARLQEQRAASTRLEAPVAPVPKSVPPRRTRRTPAH